MALLKGLESTLKRLRKPLFPSGGTPVAAGRDELMRLLPHRPPFLWVDRIDAVSLEDESVRGAYGIRRDEPVFAGHFPGEPVFPGVLLLEAMGQLALTLVHFVERQTTEIPTAVSRLPVRLTRIHHAVFQAPVGPGDTVSLAATVLERDLTLVAAAQARVADTVAAAAVLEVYLDD